MAVDEALLELASRGKIVDTLRLYVIKPSGVTVGYFQKISEAVNLEYLSEHNIPFTRRITGGGSVYHDAGGEITYAVISRVGVLPADVEESYRVICSGLVEALHLLGLEARFEPINDVTVGGKKISGSAQARRRSGVLQHGTLMYNTDLSMLANVLRAPKEKLKAKGVKSIEERVTTISRELKRRVNSKEVLDALIAGFSKALGAEFYKAELSDIEREMAAKLEEKYRSREWIFKR